MATLRTVIVDKDESYSGWDYSTLNTAESNEQGDISLTTGTDEYVVIECYATSGTADIAATILAGWTTESGNYIQIITPESYRHEGEWDTSTYRLEVTDSGGIAVNIKEDYVRLEGLQIRTPSINSSADHIINTWEINVSNDIRIEKCILRGANNSTYTQNGISISDADTIAKVGNNIVYDISGTPTNYCIMSNGASYIYNNTCIDGKYAIRGIGSSIIINNICQDAGIRSIFNQTHANTGYNVVEEAEVNSAHGTTHKTGTVTSASTGKLVDSGGGLSSIPLGSVVKDTTDTAYAYVTVIDSDTILSISSDIFNLGTENYSIFTNKVGTVNFDGSTYLLDGADTVAIDKGFNLSTDSNYPLTDDILSYTRPYNSVWDIGAYEYVPGGVTINLTGTISPVSLISGVTLYRTINLSDTIGAVFNTSGVTLYRIMDLTGTVDTISSFTCSELIIIYVLNATGGGLAWGEESPTQGEIGSPWSVWSDGAGGIPTITGDQDWGILSIDTNDEGRSNVYDYGNSVSRTYTLILNRYGSGSGTPVVQIRGQNTSFDQDDVSPSWETYSTPVAKTWRYVQVRIDYA